MIAARQREREPREGRVGHYFRIARSFAMWRRAAALPFTNLPCFRFGEVDREPEVRERRRVFFRRPFERLVARFFRRRGPPTREFANPGHPDIQSLTLYSLERR